MSTNDCVDTKHVKNKFAPTEKTTRTTSISPSNNKNEFLGTKWHKINIARVISLTVYIPKNDPLGSGSTEFTVYSW